MPAGEVGKEIDKLEGEVKKLRKALAAKGKATLGERVRATLAIFVVVFLLALFGVVWIVFGIQNVERAAIFLVPLVTLVLGFYFGTEGKKAAQDEAAKASEERKNAEVREQTAKSESVVAQAAKRDAQKENLARLKASRKTAASRLVPVKRGLKRLEKEAKK